MCVRERLFSHGSSSVRRKWSSRDMKQKPLLVIFNLSGDWTQRVDTYLALPMREETEQDMQRGAEEEERENKEVSGLGKDRRMWRRFAGDRT